MKRTFIALAAAAMLALPVSAQQKAEGLAATPQMGWNSWNKFAMNINEDLIKATADKMVELGLVDAGYVYLNIDDGWHGERDHNGFITPDPVRFPNGIRPVADYVHSKGLKLGIYSDAGTNTCGGKLGSQGHEYQDAATYASWGIDYLKYDWCSTGTRDAREAYTLMSKALAATGRPIFFSMCEWGTAKPWTWAAEIGHSWRSTGDICARFDEDLIHPTWRQLSVMSIVDLNEPLREYAGPGHWNDPDMLECGNGMSVAEDRAHFALWCMMAAPLILGNDLTAMSPEVLAIITNREMIAIDQDPLGVQGFRMGNPNRAPRIPQADTPRPGQRQQSTRRMRNNLEFWFKPLEGGDWAMTILNPSTEDKTIDLDWEKYSQDDKVSGRSLDFGTIIYKVKDIWGNDSDGTTASSRKVTIPSHDVVSYRLSPADGRITFSAAPEANQWLWYSGEKVSLKVDVSNSASSRKSASMNLRLYRDTKEQIASYSRNVSLKAGESGTVSFSFPLEPGFYRAELSIPGRTQSFNIGYDPDKVVSAPDAQPDFKEFWDRTRAELAAVDPEYQMILSESHGTPEKDNYIVKMKSLGGVEMQVVYSEPKAPGKYPVIINYMGYGSEPWYPSDPNFIEVVVSTRGQGANAPFNTYGKWVAYGLDSEYEYYYRGAFMDAVRAIDFVCTREKADQSRIFAQGGSQGGALTFAACALDDRIAAACPDVPFLSDYPDYFKIVNWPASDIFEGQKKYGLTDHQLYRVLSYFDIKNLAPWITCPIFMAFGLQDETCPPHTNFAAYNNIPHGNKRWHVYPQRGHDVWREPSWDVLKMDFFKRYL